MFSWQVFRFFKGIKTKHLMTVFAIYIGVLFCFATLYYAIYLKRPDAYIFSADIARDQQTRFITEHRQTRQELEGESQALTKLQQALVAGLKPVQNQWGLIIRLTPYTFEFFGRAINANSSYGLLAVEVSEPGKDPFTRSSLGTVVSLDPSEIRREELRPFVDEQLGKIRQNLREEERLSRIPEKDLHIWTYWDFVYFSGISITTVGFGDVLPNTTPVRLLVLSEVLIGVMLFVVVLNLVLSGNQ